MKKKISFTSRGQKADIGEYKINRIIHDEAVNVDANANDLLTHALQFWINLPSKQKAEGPDYLPVQPNEVPKKILRDGLGWLKVVAGQDEDLVSKIPSYSKQLLYHIHLEPGRQFSLEATEGFEYAAFLPLNDVVVNDTDHGKGEFIEFDKQEGTIEINNNSKEATDVILFGGEPYTESIIAHGPFVMNSQQEIAQAYTDFHAGKYGRINYQTA